MVVGKGTVVLGWGIGGGGGGVSSLVATVPLPPLLRVSGRPPVPFCLPVGPSDHWQVDRQHEHVYSLTKVVQSARRFNWLSDLQGNSTTANKGFYGSGEGRVPCQPLPAATEHAYGGGVCPSVDE
ncbi:hypothetical protein D8674_006211 [Pyrus ussuriensis x Pyrus communis]|uniref:Uncharacterized protein n=1 Tax=Pyrus ussuriensis x Pyrus communis TaxID=2448454 RepID=A0A5N5G7C9_9ROSA|nr:hypothetical protein D8674_006211 [Pyrus ussuriensis x Pyrus communis]